MENKQQTAVEWLYDQIPLEWTIKGSAKKIFEQAKAMEKEQIETAYNAGREYGCNHDDPETGEQYYNENYGLPSEH